ncbi:MAG: hypothetical protein K0S07_790 [Chlamydiales bacterium]|jgi:hypothetical protein|nr:hypothetical protein [Chlamydiales bacterium]
MGIAKEAGLLCQRRVESLDFKGVFSPSYYPHLVTSLAFISYLEKKLPRVIPEGILLSPVKATQVALTTESLFL